jgi:hypothetical protein
VQGFDTLLWYLLIVMCPFSNQNFRYFQLFPILTRWFNENSNTEKEQRGIYKIFIYLNQKELEQNREFLKDLKRI